MTVSHFLIGQLLGRIDHDAKDDQDPARFDLRHLDTLDELPSYQEEDDPEAEMQDEMDNFRTVVVTYNPNPTGGVNTLDDRFAACVPGLNLLQARCCSNVVSEQSYFGTCPGPGDGRLVFRP